MSFKFVESLENDELRLDLPTLRLINSKGFAFEGSGQFVWMPSDSKLMAFTNGGEHLTSTFGELFQCSPGQIVPDSEYLRIEGETLDKWRFETARVSKGDFHIRQGSSSVVWEIPTDHFGSQIVLSRTTESAKKTWTRLLLSEVEIPYWPRTSKTLNDNPIFGGECHTHDWLQCVGKFGTLSAKKLTDDRVEVIVNEGDYSADDLMLSIQTSFGFLSGRTVNVLGYERTEGENSRRILPIWKPEITRRRISPPLGSGPECGLFVEKFLTNAVEYFATEQGKEVGNLLFACWDVADNAFTSRILVTCAAVESFAELLGSEAHSETTLTGDQKISLMAFVTDSKFDSTFNNRLHGFLNTVNAPNARNMLEEWSRIGYSGITSDDVAAWSKLRNAAAHGRRIWSDDFERNQEALNRARRVETMINRLVLDQMGYVGHFYDYVEWNHKPMLS